MSTLPLYWGEGGDVGALLRSDAEASWVRGALESRFALEPLDVLDEAALAALDRLALAQPRILTPAENVALDAWVRRGGRLLIFADPMLTRHSRYGIGDKRRPQDVVLLSPILTHWGLALSFDPEQGEGERLVEIAGSAIPVALAGVLRPLPGSPCDVEADGLLARCRIGAGRVTIFADAAVLDEGQAGEMTSRRHALLGLVDSAFD